MAAVSRWLMVDGTSGVEFWTLAVEYFDAMNVPQNPRPAPTPTPTPPRPIPPPEPLPPNPPVPPVGR